MQKKIIGVVSACHLVLDSCQGAIPALVPFLITGHNLSYSAAGFIVFACNFASTLVQPLFGLAADRFMKVWILPCAVIIGGGSIAFMGLFSTYSLVLLMAVITGVGIAAFHPVAARLINLNGGSRQTTAMGYFGMAGNIGFTVGPLLATWAVLQWGLRGSLTFLLPSIAMTVAIMVLIKNRPFFQSSQPVIQERSPGSGSSLNHWGFFTLLMSILTTRAVFSYGLIIFIPIFWIDHLGQSPAAAGMALSVFCGANAVGSFLGGTLADRYGKIAVIVSGFLMHLPPMACLVLGTHPMTAMFMLLPLGISLSIPFNPMIVLGQEYLPNNVGLSSGMTLGVAIGIGGMAGPLVGMLADHFGVQSALQIIAFVPLVLAGSALILRIPDNFKNKHCRGI